MGIKSPIQVCHALKYTIVYLIAYVWSDAQTYMHVLFLYLKGGGTYG